MAARETSNTKEPRQALPFGVGKITVRWLAFTGLMVALFLLGLYAWTVQLNEGHIVTGLRDVGTMGGSPWGLYIVFLIYFVGVSFAGITTAALIRLLNLNHMRPVSRMAELLTIVALILATLAVMPDLGRPVTGFINLFMYARPQSPFFGTFTLVIAGYFSASLVYFYLDSRADAAILAKMRSRLRSFHRWWAAGYRGTPAEVDRHRRTSFWLAVAIIPILVMATSTLGFVFGLQVGRPGWYSALQAPAFVVLAWVSGIGALLIIAAAVRWSLRDGEKLNEAVFKSLGKMLLVLIPAYLYFVMVELLTSLYTAHHHERALTQALLFGEYAWIYWTSMAFLLIPLVILSLQALTRRWNVPLLVLSGVLVNLAAIGKRYIIVVPSLTHGTLLPYGAGSYAPTWVEYALVLGLFGLGGLLIALFAKVFPIMDVAEQPEGGGAGA